MGTNLGNMFHINTARLMYLKKEKNPSYSNYRTNFINSPHSDTLTREFINNVLNVQKQHYITKIDTGPFGR